MKSIYFLFLFIVSASFAYGEEACDQFGYGEVYDQDLGDVADTVTKSCDDKSLNQKELCKCLSDAKFNEIKVGWKTKKDFHQWEFDKSLREKLNHAVHDQISNFTKFSNLLKTKQHIGNLIDDSEPLCNIETITKDIEAVQKISGSPECPTPKGFLPNRLKEIFGTTNPKEISDKLKFDTTKVDEKSCISTQLYLDLRANSGAAAKGFRNLIAGGVEGDMVTTVKNLPNEEKSAYKDLLSYDVFFNLAYRDETFRNKLNKNLETVTSAEGGKTFDIYNDPDTLKEAFKSLNRSCNQLMKNVKGFLCANDHPQFDAPIMRDHLDDYLSGKKGIDADERNSIRDYLTDRYSCKERTATVYRRTVGQVIRGEDKVQINQSLEEKEFEAFIGNVVLLKTTTESFQKDDPKSDINTFNRMFCEGRGGKEITQEDLPEMLQKFIASGGDKIAKILEDQELQKKLGLKIKTNPISFALLDEDDIKAGKIPKINQFKWEETMAPALLKAGLSKEEVSQIYAIIEMQTNRKFSEMDDLRSKLVADNTAFKDVSVADIEAIAVRRDPAVISRVNNQLASNPATSNLNVETAIDSRYSALKTDATQRADTAQSLFRGETSVAQLKEEATTYNNNRGTYDSNFNSDKPAKTLANFTATPPSQNPSQTQEQPLIEPRRSPASTDEERPSVASNSQSKLPTPVAPAVQSIQYNNSPISSQSSSSSSYEPSYSPSKSSSNEEDSYTKDMKKRIADAQKKIDAWKDEQDFYENQIKDIKNRQAQSAQRSADFNSNTSNNSNSANLSRRETDPNYNYPENIPFKNSKGEHFYPERQFSSDDTTGQNNQLDNSEELAETGSSTNKAGHGGGGGSASSAGSPSSGSSAGGGTGVSPDIVNSLSNSFPNAGKSTETEAEMRARLELAPYEHHKMIPYALVEAIGLDKTVLILSLEGKKFKTVEADQKFIDNKTLAKETKYYIRTYDFVPEGEFEDMKEDFISKESREATFQKYFGYPRNAKNAIVSSKYATATKEISKVEVGHAHVLEIQKDIYSKSELSALIIETNNNIQRSIAGQVDE